MVKNYIKIAWRILLRQKYFSLINILGLAVGMAACLLIVQYLSFELSYDNFYSNGSRIYRIKHQNYSQGNLIENMPKTYSAVGPAMKKEFPEVQDMARVSPGEGLVISQQPGGSMIAFNEHNLYFVDASFLKIFSFPMMEGSVNSLANENSVVITEKTAEKYFPNQDALGKTLKIQQQVSGTDITATVTGVCKDVPANSHLQFDFLVSYNLKDGDWVYPDSYTYVLLSPNTKAKALEAKLPAFVKKYTSLSSDKTNSSFTQGKSNLSNISLSLQPLRDIHLYSNLSQEISIGGNGKLVWFLGVIAVLILLIAYINYLNLSTGKIIERAKEVGIRKVMGSQRIQLIKQFLFESLLVNIFGFVAAIVIVLLCMPWFSTICGVDLHFTLWNDFSFILGFIGCLVLGVALSALYPALVLSNYKPIEILKGKFSNSTKSIALRKGLVVFQFVATITFMVGTMVVYQQVNYMRSEENKAMDMNQTLVVVAPQNVRASDQDNADYAYKDSVFQTEILRNPSIKDISSSSSIPGQNIGFIMSYTSHAQTANEKSLRLSTMEIGSRFIDQFKIKLVAGKTLANDSWDRKTPAMMLNVAAVASLGFKDAKDAIGKLVETRNGRGKRFQNEVVGVIQNFHQNSLKEAFSPIVFRLSDPNSTTHYEIKLAANNLPATIAQIGKTFKKVYPASGFEYFFLDDFFNEQYKVEQHFGEVFSLFAGFAIFVACLGLFGLTLITITQRIKEIGIRKVLGATIPDLLLLISKDFIGLIFIANIIALPLSFWGGYTWLQGYAFRISLNGWYFIIPMVAVLLIALLTVSYQAVKAALANPITALRSE